MEGTALTLRTLSPRRRTGIPGPSAQPEKGRGFSEPSSVTRIAFRVTHGRLMSGGGEGGESRVAISLSSPAERRIRVKVSRSDDCIPRRNSARTEGGGTIARNPLGRSPGRWVHARNSHARGGGGGRVESDGSVHSARVAGIKGDARRTDPSLAAAMSFSRNRSRTRWRASGPSSGEKFASLNARARAHNSRTFDRVGDSFTPGFPIERDSSPEVSTRLESARERARRRDRDAGRSPSEEMLAESRVYPGTHEVESSPRSPSIYI